MQWNLLVLHAEESRRAELGVHVDPGEWSYVALGHFHVYREIAPNAYYSGSIEYTSANAWGELVEERQAGVPGKGFIERDLDTGAHTFHPIDHARRLVDLPTVSARGTWPVTGMPRARASATAARNDSGERFV